MIRKLKISYPYYILQDTNQVNQYCVMVETPYGFSQQISPWYFRFGNCLNRYNKILNDATWKILNHDNR